MFVFNKDLLDLSVFSLDALEEILDRASFYRDEIGRRTFTALEGHSITVSFWEHSTRTRLSFELAIKELGGRVVGYYPETASEQKGETMEDTVKTLISLGSSAVVFRHSLPGLFHRMAREADIPFISAGEGCYQHPTQALLDVFTMRQAGLKLEGLKVAMVGDILHSRVARSHMYALPLFGAELAFVAPPALLPTELVPGGIQYYRNLEEALSWADVIYLLRVQKERQEQGLLPSLGEYAALYGLDMNRLSRVKEKACFMHPGPINPGVEISHQVLRALESYAPERTLFREQVKNGLFVRMAVLDLLVGSGKTSWR